MAAYKIPRLIAFMDALPRTASGKLMWRALQEKEFSGSWRAGDESTPVA